MDKICRECAVAKGGRMNETISTVHLALCPHCDEEKHLWPTHKIYWPESIYKEMVGYTKLKP